MIKANIPPDEHTYGVVGDTYLDQSTNTIYRCVDVSHPVSDYGFVDVTSFRVEESKYTWEEIAEKPEPTKPPAVVLSDITGSMDTYGANFAKYVTELIVPEGVTSLNYSTSAGSYDSSNPPLNDFENLKRLVLPSTFTGWAIGDSDSNFSFYLDELVLSEGTTSIDNDDSLGYIPTKRLVIPSSMTHINLYTFTNGYYPKEIVINKPEGSIEGAPWGADWATITWNG